MVPTGQTRMTEATVRQHRRKIGWSISILTFCIMHTMRWHWDKKQKGAAKRMHGWEVRSSEFRLYHVTSQVYSSKAASKKQRGTQPLAPAVKLAQWQQHGSITWDITLSRPIQHCEEHNRQNWPFKHTLPLCRTTDCVSPCRATGQTQRSLQWCGERLGD